MPKGRGSNERRRSERQKIAIRISKLPDKHPRALFHDTMKRRRMIGKRGPATVDDPHTWELKDHPRTVEAQKQTEANKRRRARNWKGN